MCVLSSGLFEDNAWGQRSIGSGDFNVFIIITEVHVWLNFIILIVDFEMLLPKVSKWVRFIERDERKKCNWLTGN